MFHCLLIFIIGFPFALFAENCKYPSESSLLSKQRLCESQGFEWQCSYQFCFKKIEKEYSDTMKNRCQAQRQLDEKNICLQNLDIYIKGIITLNKKCQIRECSQDESFFWNALFECQNSLCLQQKNQLLEIVTRNIDTCLNIKSRSEKTLCLTQKRSFFSQIKNCTTPDCQQELINEEQRFSSEKKICQDRIVCLKNIDLLHDKYIQCSDLTCRKQYLSILDLFLAQHKNCQIYSLGVDQTICQNYSYQYLSKLLQCSTIQCQDEIKKEIDLQNPFPSFCQLFTPPSLPHDLCKQKLSLFNMQKQSCLQSSCQTILTKAKEVLDKEQIFCIEQFNPKEYCRDPLDEWVRQFLNCNNADCQNQLINILLSQQSERGQIPLLWPNEEIANGVQLAQSATHRRYLCQKQLKKCDIFTPFWSTYKELETSCSQLPIKSKVDCFTKLKTLSQSFFKCQLPSCEQGLLNQINQVKSQVTNCQDKENCFSTLSGNNILPSSTPTPTPTQSATPSEGIRPTTQIEQEISALFQQENERCQKMTIVEEKTKCLERLQALQNQFAGCLDENCLRALKLELAPPSYRPSTPTPGPSLTPTQNPLSTPITTPTSKPIITPTVKVSLTPPPLPTPALSISPVTSITPTPSPLPPTVSTTAEPNLTPTANSSCSSEDCQKAKKDGEDFIATEQAKCEKIRNATQKQRCLAQLNQWNSSFSSCQDEQCYSDLMDRSEEMSDAVKDCKTSTCVSDIQNIFSEREECYQKATPEEQEACLGVFNQFINEFHSESEQCREQKSQLCEQQLNSYLSQSQQCLPKAGAEAQNCLDSVKYNVAATICSGSQKETETCRANQAEGEGGGDVRWHCAARACLSPEQFGQISAAHQECLKLTGAARQSCLNKLDSAIQKFGNFLDQVNQGEFSHEKFEPEESPDALVKAILAMHALNVACIGPCIGPVLAVGTGIFGLVSEIKSNKELEEAQENLEETFTEKIKQIREGGGAQIQIEALQSIEDGLNEIGDVLEKKHKNYQIQIGLYSAALAVSVVEAPLLCFMSPSAVVTTAAALGVGVPLSKTTAEMADETFSRSEYVAKIKKLIETFFSSEVGHSFSTGDATPTAPTIGSTSQIGAPTSSSNTQATTSYNGKKNDQEDNQENLSGINKNKSNDSGDSDDRNNNRNNDRNNDHHDDRNGNRNDEGSENIGEGDNTDNTGDSNNPSGSTDGSGCINKQGSSDPDCSCKKTNSCFKIQIPTTYEGETIQPPTLESVKKGDQSIEPESPFKPGPNSEDRFIKELTEVANQQKNPLGIKANSADQQNSKKLGNLSKDSVRSLPPFGKVDHDFGIADQAVKLNHAFKGQLNTNKMDREKLGKETDRSVRLAKQYLSNYNDSLLKQKKVPLIRGISAKDGLDYYNNQLTVPQKMELEKRFPQINQPSPYKDLNNLLSNSQKDLMDINDLNLKKDRLNTLNNFQAYSPGSGSSNSRGSENGFRRQGSQSSFDQQDSKRKKSSPIADSSGSLWQRLSNRYQIIFISTDKKNKK